MLNNYLVLSHRRIDVRELAHGLAGGIRDERHVGQPDAVFLLDLRIDPLAEFDQARKVTFVKGGDVR